tara:strand:- start:2027 stop:3211 length:1185 start_codon:yes stop_codon:yes gene_type:complete
LEKTAAHLSRCKLTNRRWLPLLAAAGLGVSIAVVHAAQPDTLTSRVDALFADYNSDSQPGCAVGVIHQGHYALAKTYGSANLEHNIPLSTQSVFRVGSVSKQFTAAAIAILAVRGDLDLDADVHEYLPDLRRYDYPVTIRQMLHHTSGMGEYEGTNAYELTPGKNFRFGNEDYWTIEEFYQRVRQQPLALRPGERFEYSNIAYFLLSQVVEAVSGKTLRQFADAELFGPLDMRASFFNDNVNAIVPHRADGYAVLEDGSFEIFMTNLDWVGDGGVYTTLDDFIKWDRAFITGGVPGGEQVHSLMTTADPLTIATMARDSLDMGSGYGFGLEVGTYKGHKAHVHGGSWVGFRAFYARLPDDGLSVVMLCNREDALENDRYLALLDIAMAELLPAE